MSSLTIDALITHVVVTDDALTVNRGTGIHWSELDEDISVESICLGQRSQEGLKSLQRRLDERGH